MTDVPQISQPFRFDAITGDVVTIEQDSDTDIMQCVENIASFIIGTREERPDFGITDQTFREKGFNLTQFQKEITKLEPRANLLFETQADWEALAEHIAVRLSRSVGTRE